MKRHLIYLLLITFILAIVACGSSEPEPPEPVTFRIEMTEYAFSPNEINVSVGQEVTLTLINKGQLEHEIMFGRDVVEENGRPNGYSVDLFEFAGVEPMVEGGMLMIDGEMIRQDNHDEAMTENMEEAEHDEEMAMGEDGEEHDEEMSMEEDDPAHGHAGLMVMLPKPDDRATMTFLVTEEMVGSWEIGCFELDGVHYDSGMKGILSVSDS